MAAYLPVVRVCTALSREPLKTSHSRLCSTDTHYGSEYAAITPATSMSTDTIEPLL